MADYCDLTVLIVDDEKKACINLKNMLRDYIDIPILVAGMSNNTRDAEKLIEQYKPDAVFLDIDMPKENAFHFLNRIAPVNFDVVFVTAFDEYALKAFKANAVDYILKPISITELKNAVAKLKERQKLKQLTDTDNNYNELSEQLQKREKINKIILKSSNCKEVVDFRNIYFVEAQSSYSKVVFSKGGDMKEMLMSYPLSAYEELFPPDMFFRVHRSFLINCIYLKELNSEEENYYMHLKGNYKIPISRRRHTALLDFLKTNDGFK